MRDLDMRRYLTNNGRPLSKLISFLLWHKKVDVWPFYYQLLELC